MSVYQSNMIRAGMFFPIHEYLKVNLKKNFSNYKYQEQVSSLVASFSTRLFLSLITFPFEITKINIQLGNASSQNSFYNSLRFILQRPKSASKVFFPFVGRELFFTQVFWSIYETNRTVLFEEEKRNKVKSKVVSAVIAGGCASFMTFPFDVAQTTAVFLKNKQGVFSIYRELIKKHGIGFITNGLNVRVFRSMMQCFLYYGINESLKEHHQYK